MNNSIALLAIFFFLNTFLLSFVFKNKMNTVSFSYRYLFASMFLMIILLIFESIIGLFKISYDKSSNFIGSGTIVFLIIQLMLLLVYLINWKSYKINFDIKLDKILFFSFILIFILGIYYGFILKTKIQFDIDSSHDWYSAFGSSFKMLISVTSVTNNDKINNFLIKNVVNIYLLSLISFSINSLGNNNFFIIIKKFSFTIFIMSIFLLIKSINNNVCFLFMMVYLINLYSFYSNHRDSILNDGDKNNVLIFTMLSIICFNYWFLLITIILGFLFIIYSFKFRTTVTIIESFKIINFMFLAMALSLTSFKMQIVGDNGFFFYTKIFLTIILLGIFFIFAFLHNLIKNNQKYRVYFYKIGLISTNNFNKIFLVLLFSEYFIILILILVKVIIIYEPNSFKMTINNIFRFFSIKEHDHKTTIFFFLFWVMAILIWSFVSFYKRVLIKKYNFKKIKFNLNFLYISFFSIWIFFNPLFSQVIWIILNDKYIKGFFNIGINNFGQTISFLNIIWVLPILIIILRFNEDMYKIRLNWKYILSLEIVFNTILLSFPIYQFIITNHKDLHGF
ncbi:MAG: hypothetical protein ACRCW6_02200 [Mycoplasmoidaceae bacterium]